jgi:hypothetical protein
VKIKKEWEVVERRRIKREREVREECGSALSSLSLYALCSALLLFLHSLAERRGVKKIEIERRRCSKGITREEAC